MAANRKAGDLNIARFLFMGFLKSKMYSPTLLTYQNHATARQKLRGFTIIELITIIIILGILAAIAAPRFFDRNVFASRGFHDQVIATLRHAQKTAIAQRRFVCVAFSAVGVTPGKVTVTTGATNSCGMPLTSPSGLTPYEISSNSAFFSAIPLPAGNISFDCLGRPRDITTAAACNTAAGILVLPTTITVNNYGASIIVERETGYVRSP